MCCLLLFFFPFYLKKQEKQQGELEKYQLEFAFRDSLQSLSSALEAGYSVENALSEIVKDLNILYLKDARIVKEFEFMVRQVKNNISVEQVFFELAQRIKLEDAESFAEVFITAKRSGGDLIKIAKRTSNTICEKAEVLQEIQTMITAKKYEAKIMKLVPYAILAYFNFFSPEYLSALYGNFPGIILMSILLILYQSANYLASKITTIEV